MKIIFLTLFIASLKGPVIVDPPIRNHDELMERIEQKFIGYRSPLYGWMEPPKLAVVDWVTPEYRPIAIEYLKSKAKDSQHLERAQRALIALDDEETLVDAIKQFKEGTTQNPSILAQNLPTNRIKDLIPVVYEGSEHSIKLDIGNVKSSRYQAVDLILGRIVRSQLYPDSTRRWASAFVSNSYNFGTNPHIIWLFQQWWEHNKEAVLAEKFSEATWVPMFKSAPDVFSENVRNDPEYRNYTPATRNDILPIPKQASIVLKTRGSPPETKPSREAIPATKSNSMIVYFVLGLFGLFAAGWAWSKRKSAG